MAGFDLFIDHVTGDLVDAGDGGFELTDTAATAVYLQFCVELNSSVAEPDLGGRAHEVPKKNTISTAIGLKVAYDEALQPLVDDGRIVDPKVSYERNKLGKIVFRSSARDAQRGDLDLSELLPYTPGEM